MKKILKIIDEKGLLILRKNENIKLLNKILIIFNQINIKMIKKKRDFEKTKIIKNVKKEENE